MFEPCKKSELENAQFVTILQFCTD